MVVVVCAVVTVETAHRRIVLVLIAEHLIEVGDQIGAVQRVVVLMMKMSTTTAWRRGGLLQFIGERVDVRQEVTERGPSSGGQLPALLLLLVEGRQQIRLLLLQVNQLQRQLRLALVGEAERRLQLLILRGQRANGLLQTGHLTGEQTDLRRLLHRLLGAPAQVLLQGGHLFVR